MTRRRAVPVFFVSLTIVMAAAAVAWTCTPSAYLFPIAPASGPAGSEVTLRGGQFGAGPVEIRWAADTGRLLGTALGPDFAIKVRIPDSSPEVHYLVAIARDPADPTKILARRAEAFELTAAAGASRSAESFWGAGLERATQPTNNPGSAAGIAAVTLGMAFVVMASALLVVARRKRARS